MRKFEKKYILELLDTIGQAHNEYKKLKLKEEYYACMSILSACQESAISIGNAIDKSEGEGTESVKLLEEYCEDLYQCSKGHDEINLNTILEKVRVCVCNEIKVTYEVVFFPYKASMWDSMESIYLAFKSCKNVNVYIVPIPYYNRKNDGTVECMHCEGDFFPLNEEVTDWRAFDLEKIRPDIAFIHNPYDDMNFVTTVDPRFYSFELKKYTDCLVYCPYFSTVGMIPKAQRLCKSYIYADYILTQSSYQIGFFDDAIPRKKFLPLGSPKFDKIISLANEKRLRPDLFYMRVPSEWRRKHLGKKVYFYNTSISGLLGNTSLFLDKMEYVFKIFDKQNNVLLLWRPHPLLEDTLKAMRVEFYDRYCRIKQDFLTKDIGILDETPDISTSVAYSDVFIGDGATSITSLFEASGKEVFILNNAILREPLEQDINDYLFQVPFEPYQNGYIITPGNLLFKCDLRLSNSMDYHYVRRLSDYLAPLYNKCFEFEDKIFFTPVWAEVILVYNLNGDINRIELNKCDGCTHAFFTSHFIDHYIILVPDEYPYFVRLDLITNDIEYSEDLRDIYISEDDNYTRYYGGSEIFHDCIFVASRENNRVLQLNIGSLQYNVLTIGEDVGSGFSKVSYICDASNNEESLIFLPYRGTVINRYYPVTGEMQRYDAYCADFHCSGQDTGNINDDIIPFSSAVLKDERLYLAPYRGNKFISINIITKKSTEWNFPLSLEWQASSGYYTGEYKGRFVQYNNKYYWVSGTQRRLYEIKIEADECKIIKEIPVRFNSEEVRKHANGFSLYTPCWTQYSIKEDAINTLSAFLSGKVYGAPFNQQKELDSFKKVAVNLDGTCGQHVCDFLMKKMEL